MSNDPNLQPIRLWYEYLKTALQHNMKVDRTIYKSWDLDQIYRAKEDKGFDKWFKTHRHLFADEETEIKLVKGGSARKPNTVLVQIPTNFNVRRVTSEIGAVISEHLSQSNAKFSITSKRSLQIAPMDYMRWCWIARHDKDQSESSLTDIYKQVEGYQIRRTKKRRGTTKSGKDRELKGRPKDDTKTQQRNPAVMVSKNIRKAEIIINNVCKGVFPGDYSIS